MWQVVKRLVSAISTLAGIIIVTFFMTRLLPGDPAAYFAGPAATAASIEETRHRLGLDGSVPEQFVRYVEGLARGNLGNSLTSGQTVLSDLRTRLPASLELTFDALILALGLGIPLGIGAALKPGGWVDRFCSFISTAGQATPTFFLGLLLVFVLYYLLGWAPAPLGRLDIIYSPPDEITGFWSIDAALGGDWQLVGAVLAQLVLPVTTLGLFGLGPLARVTRAGMIEVLASDYVRTARAAGLPRHKVLWTYAFRNTVVPVLNTAGMVFSYMLGASVLVEKVFGWPGIGAYAIDAVLASDFAPVQGFVLTMAILYLLLNLAIDTAVGILDPRVRYNV
jgi:ABC-type dipeptide/oligopeptide/nickel transport system permease component